MARRLGPKWNGFVDAVAVKSGTSSTFSKSKAASLVQDSADSYNLKTKKNGTVATILDSSNYATVTNGTGTTTAGTMKVAKVSLAGATWHTGNGTADYLSWTNPEAGTILITGVVVNTTTKSTGAATADIGTTATNNHTSSDNLLDGLDIGTAAGTFDIITDHGTNGKSRQSLATGAFVTFHALADPTGTVGNAYIYYTIA